MPLAAPIIILGAGALALLAMSSKKKTVSEGTSSAAVEAVNASTSAPSTSQERAAKATSYQVEVAKAVEGLNVDPTTYQIRTPPSEENLQYASGLAARMKADGFVAEAAALDKLVQQAIALKPAPTVVAIPSIPVALQQELNNVIKYSKDPQKLRAVADALRKLPASKTDQNIINSIEMVEELAAQIEAQQKTAQALQKIDVVIQSPTAPVTITTSSPPVPQISPAAPTAAPSVVTTPSVTAAPKTPVETAADLMVAHLLRVQTSYGGVPKCKGKEDTNVVKKFQTLAKLSSPDGKAGPGTLAAAAANGQYNLPFVMYWPKSATKAKVLEYRATLNAIADKLEPTNPSGAEELRQSAARERGQAGIVGQMPA